jgi:hypothetical protein
MLPSSEITYTALRELVPGGKPVGMTEGFLHHRHDDEFPDYKFLVLSTTSLFIVTMNLELVLTPAGERHYTKRLAHGQSENMAMQNAEDRYGKVSRYKSDIGKVEEVPLCDVHVLYHGRWLASNEIWVSFIGEFEIDLEADTFYDFPVALGMEIDISSAQWSFTSTLDSGLGSFAEALISSTTRMA